MIFTVAPSLVNDAADLAMAAIPGMDEVYVALTHPVRRTQRPVGPLSCVELSIEQAEMLADWCSAHSTTTHGATADERRRAGRLWRAQVSLRRELQRLGNHPAFLGQAVMGTDRTVFPAWRAGGPPRVTVIGAIVAGDGSEPERCWLLPEQFTLDGKTLTRWSASADREPHPT